jgi:mono/diheme cytochrome c family protein
VRRWIAAAGIALLAGAPASSARADGKATYEAKCAKCHGQTGLADTKTGKAAKAKKFQGDEKLMGDDVADVVLKSVRDPEKKKHRQVAKKVTDEELAAIALYVRTLATTAP